MDRGSIYSVQKKKVVCETALKQLKAKGKKNTWQSTITPENPLTMFAMTNLSLSRIVTQKNLKSAMPREAIEYYHHQCTWTPRHNLFSINVRQLVSCGTLLLILKCMPSLVTFTAVGTYHLVRLRGCQQRVGAPAANPNAMIDFHHASRSLGKLGKKKKKRTDTV